MKFSNKTVLITGASSGMGRAFAFRIAKDKPKIIIASRKLDELNLLKSELEKLGAEVSVVPTDLRKEDDINNLFSNIQAIDFVFNNAGLGFEGVSEEIDSEKIDAMVETNFTAMIKVANLSLKIMKPQGYGHIMFTSSVAALFPVPEFAVYSGTKWGITGFADALRFEIKNHNIKITTLHPGVVNTKFFDKESKNYNRGLKPEQVANAIYQAAFTNRKRIYIPFYVGVVDFAYKYFPWLAALVLR